LHIESIAGYFCLKTTSKEIAYLSKSKENDAFRVLSMASKSALACQFFSSSTTYSALATKLWLKTIFSIVILLFSIVTIVAKKKTLVN